MDKMTEKALIAKELSNIIEKEIEVLLNKGLPDKKAVRLGINAAINKWEKYNAYQSGS